MSFGVSSHHRCGFFNYKVRKIRHVLPDFLYLGWVTPVLWWPYLFFGGAYLFFMCCRGGIWIIHAVYVGIVQPMYSMNRVVARRCSIV